jgi:hypothetical protein
MRLEVVPGIQLDSEWLPEEKNWEHSMIVPQYSIIVNFTSSQARSFGAKLRRRGTFEDNHKLIAPSTGPGLLLDSKWVEGPSEHTPELIRWDQAVHWGVGPERLSGHWEHEIYIKDFDATVVLYSEEARKVGGALYRRGARDVVPDKEPYVDAAIVERLLDGYTAREAGIPIGWKDVYIREFHEQGMNYREVCELLQISGESYRKALENDQK